MRAEPPLQRILQRLDYALELGGNDESGRNCQFDGVTIDFVSANVVSGAIAKEIWYLLPLEFSIGV